MDKYLLKLFITGQTPRSQRAIDNLRRICEDELPADCEVILIDILEQPQLAEEHKILATPTLIRELPLPARRIVGDLSDIKQVLLGLELSDRERGGEE